MPSDDVGNGVMDFCSKQSVSVIDLASAALKTSARAGTSSSAAAALMDDSMRAQYLDTELSYYHHCQASLPSIGE